MLGSGFWLIATERFDPHTAKKRFGQIAGIGTLGGLIGGLLAERVAAVLTIAAMLPLLAVLSVVGAWHMRRLGASVGSANTAGDIAPDLLAEPPRSGLRVLADAPYLRHLAAVVLLGTMAAALADYVFKGQAVAAFGKGQDLLRFFALFYAATSLITFVVQTSASRLALQKLGLATTTGTPAVALLVGSIGGLIAPGLSSVMVARGGESVFRGSLFRSGYELFYTPIPAAEKRAAKSLIDVGFDRLGDALGGGTIRLLLLIVAPARQYAALLWLAIACSAGALVVGRSLTRGYIDTLERSLRNRAVELDLADVTDTTTRTTMLRTMSLVRSLADMKPESRGPAPFEKSPAAGATPPAPALPGLDAEMQQILALRSRDRARVLRVLDSDDALLASLVPHVIPLLAWDPVANDAVQALRRVAETRIGQFVDALGDPNQDFAVRRRLARVFSACASQRAADGVQVGLEDLRFEVRFRCARSLAAILKRNPSIRIEREFIFEVVRREAAVGRPVWESHRLLHQLDEHDGDLFVDEVVKDRANRSLEHVFTLLSLVLPSEPLQIAYRGLLTDDPSLRGTALEYLEGVLPPPIRERLWPFLEDKRPLNRPTRPREEIIADLLRSHESISVNLEELKHRASKTAKPDRSPWQPT